MFDVINYLQTQTSGLSFWLYRDTLFALGYIYEWTVVTTKRTGSTLTPLLTVGGLSRESPPTVRRGVRGALSVGGQPTLPWSPLVL